jgi:hypothetical protein
MSLDNRDALIAHINHLDGVIRQRNERIRELEKLLNTPVNLDAAAKREIGFAYNLGWHLSLIHI